MLGKLLSPPTAGPTWHPQRRQKLRKSHHPHPAMATLSPELPTDAPVSHASRRNHPRHCAIPCLRSQGGHDGIDDHDVDHGTTMFAASGNSCSAASTTTAPPAGTTTTGPDRHRTARLPRSRHPRTAPRGAARPAAEQRRGPGGQQQWPIHPMAGEPPLTLSAARSCANCRGQRARPVRRPERKPDLRRRDAVRRAFAGAGVGQPAVPRVPGAASARGAGRRRDPVVQPARRRFGVLAAASIDELVAVGDLLELDPGEPPID